MKKIQTVVKRIYWEEDPNDGKGEGIMIFELVNGRKLELIYNTEEVAECMGDSVKVVTSLGFVTAI